MFYIKERISKAKLLQIVSGANKFIFWMVAFIFDYGIYFLVMIVYVLATAAYQKEGFSTFEELSRITLVLLAFGLAALPFTYVLSFAFKVPTTGLVTLTIGYIITGTLFYTVYFTLHSDFLDLKWVSVPLGWTFLIFPHYSLTRAYSNLNIMQTTIAACDRNCKLFGIGDNCEPICELDVPNCSDVFPGPLCDVRDSCCARAFFSFDETAIGIMLVALIVVCIASFFILFILEFKVFRTFINYLRNRKV
jgi:ATP-binding cassette subfamily A (ABC1) protein 3